MSSQGTYKRENPRKGEIKGSLADLAISFEVSFTSVKLVSMDNCPINIADCNCPSELSLQRTFKF
jgi:hypothetical protein